MRREARLRRESDNPWRDWLTPEQELMRLRGLRILARMIARRHLREQGLVQDEEADARDLIPVEADPAQPEDLHKIL